MAGKASLGTVLVLGRPVDPAVEATLSSRLTVILGERFTREQALDAIAQADAVYLSEPAYLDAELIAAGKNVRVIGTVGSGNNRIDADAATAAGIPVINGAGAAFHSVAEHAIGFMLSLQKRIAQFDRWMHAEKRFPGTVERQELFGTPGELQGKTVGIVGLGYIGKDIAEKARLGFNMEVLGFDPFVARFEAGRQHITLFRDLGDMIGRCDFLVIACPLTSVTRGLIGADLLARLPKSAFVIIVSRGGIVAEAALVDALRSGTIAGAAVDVYDPEPPAPGNPLFDIGNCVVTPHNAGGTREAFHQLAVTVPEQMIEAMDGHRPDNVTNPSTWETYRRRWFDGPQ
jgi:phosphoglycerate dehydrogenase-like enzyme